jgi:queuine/archaeosine tRNA-ribosyltransferase
LEFPQFRGILPALHNLSWDTKNAQAPAAAAGHNNGLETRISDLHQKLQITPEQEDKWKAVAKVMRTNAEASRSLVEEKRKDEANLTAVADLNAYADIAEAHARHVRHLAKVFAALYDSMNDDQKKAADEVFREHKRKSSEDLTQHGAQ